LLWYSKDDGSLKELDQKSVDFGGGFERMVAAVNKDPDIFKTDLFWQVIQAIETSTGVKYGQVEVETISMRVIADHLKAAVFMINEGLVPGNKQQGYVLRRLIRRAAVKMHKLTGNFSKVELSKKVYDAVGKIYQDVYFETKSKQFVDNKVILTEEIDKFERVLNKGIKYLYKQTKIDGKQAFFLLQSFGFPWELTLELAQELGYQIKTNDFQKEFKIHQELSRTAASGMFKGGLADKSEETTKLHTTTHLVHQALRTVLGSHVDQKGSNITKERLRFDFSHKTKLSGDEKEKVEALVNEQITKNLPVSFVVTSLDEAKKMGALAFFGQRYPEKVKVYTVGDPDGIYFSREICGGPHVEKTGVLGSFKVIKEESAGSGIRRIYATLSK
ncbi:alanine--tRNA ligase-related protein, partial [Patescibacteria group bacterium]